MYNRENSPLLFGGVMGKDIDYIRWNEAMGRAGDNLGLDPRLVSLVKFLARRAAEADYAEECAVATHDDSVPTKKEEMP